MLHLKKHLFMKNFFTKFNFQSNLLFIGLSTEEQLEVSILTEPLIIKKGSLLFYEEGIPTGIFQIKKGSAKKFKHGFNGEDQIFYIYTSGDVLGYHALLGEERYQDSCEALEDLEVNFISKSNFLKLLNKMSALQKAVIKNISHEFGVLANTIALLAQKDQNGRLAIFLLLLEQRFNLKNKISKGIDISRDDLANLIGTSRESLGRSLKFFKDEEIIDINKKIIYIKNKNFLLRFLQLELTT